MWMGFGPHENYSYSWQMIINILSNIVTLFMVFLIQAAQIQDTRALVFRLDALIAATEKADAATALHYATEKVLLELHEQGPLHPVPPV